ncbi:MAG: 2-C-methyl-D-erythritol 4-phosphate cytidylyltransferase [Pirellulaceae bacterium]
MPTFSVILAAAGASTRFNDPHYKKTFAHLNQKPVWLYSAEKFLARPDVKQLIVVISREDEEDFRARFAANVAVMGIDITFGGAERCHSIQNGLELVSAECDHVIIHDAARPCIADEWIEELFAVGARSGAAILATPVTSTLKRSQDGKQVDETVPRDGLWMAQTPQCFRVDLLRDAFARRSEDFLPTDESQLVEAMGYPVAMVTGSPLNIKITTKADLAFAAACLKALPTPRFDAPLHPFQDDNLWR